MPSQRIPRPWAAAGGGGSAPPVMIPAPGGRDESGALTPLPDDARIPASRSGGMADAGDSKSPEGNLMRVRIPPPAPGFVLDPGRERSLSRRSRRRSRTFDEVKAGSRTPPWQASLILAGWRRPPTTHPRDAPPRQQQMAVRPSPALVPTPPATAMDCCQRDGGAIPSLLCVVREPAGGRKPSPALVPTPSATAMAAADGTVPRSPRYFVSSESQRVVVSRPPPSYRPPRQRPLTAAIRYGGVARVL